jgi:ferredoxin/thiol-disulfide isomerase/thioredoxin
LAKLKSFFIKVGHWLKNHAPSKRRVIQLYSALLHNANIKGYIQGRIYTGPVKNLCSPGLNCYSCPGASAACPIGALQDSLAQSNTRLPYYIIGIIALWGLIFARTICGFLCPVGFGQELLYKIKTPKAKKNRITRVLSYFKYVLLVVMVISIPLIYHGIPAFCKYICPAGTFEGGVGLLAVESNSDFYAMLSYLFSWKFILLVIFIVCSIFIYRFFCRFICPLGAIYGFFNKYALLGVKLEENKCVNCGMCISTCKMDIRHVGDHECINCGECIPVCPTKAISWKGSKIFLKGAQIDDTANGEGQGKLAAMTANGSIKLGATEEQLNGGIAIFTTDDTTPILVNDQTVAEAPLPKMLQESQNKAQTALNVTDDQVIEETKAELNNGKNKGTKLQLTQSQKIKKRNFWLQVGAWIVALGLLLTALLYYNVFDTQTNLTVYQVGDRCPDFTVETFETAGVYDNNGNKMTTFSTIEHKGTVMVFNFWYTTCDPCLEELPYFESVRSEFGDSIYMVALHAAGLASYNSIQNFINSTDDKGKVDWADYGIIFALDTEELQLFNTLGGKDAYPATVVVDKDGKIAYINQGKLSEEKLRSQIEEVLNR